MSYTLFLFIQFFFNYACMLKYYFFCMALALFICTFVYKLWQF